MSLLSRLPVRARSAMGPAVERVIYQAQLSDDDGEFFRANPLKRFSVRATRALVERGSAPPWVWSEEKCQQFWGVGDHSQDGNAPSDYAGKSTTIVDALDEFWRPNVDPSSSLLEVGCNAGANLEALRRKGFERLAGVDISTRALDHLRETFPDLAQIAELHNGEAAEVLAGMPDGSVDVVFSMAVLLHVHPSGNRLFEEMSRVARRHICVVEAENIVCGYVFPRNYRRVFEGLGWAQMRSVALRRRSHPEIDDDYYGYTARLFRPAPR